MVETTRVAHPIELAYQAAQYVPTEAYRTHQDRRKKMYNPIKTAPTVVQAMDHLGPGAMSLADAKQRARRAVLEQEAQRYIDRVRDWAQLRDFLDTLALFLKAEVQGGQGRQRRRQVMRKFEPQSQDRWETNQLVPRAQALADQIASQRDVNVNKLKKLESRIKGCRDVWEVLASLAQYYPLSGTPTRAIDELVGYLGQVDLETFKQLVSYTVVFYRAQEIKKGDKTP